MILLIDNYDSFAHNLARYLRLLGQKTKVIRNDQLNVSNIENDKPKAIVISPGPCGPSEAGYSLDVFRSYYKKIPILGICLGHQVIAAGLGCEIIRANIPMHGRTSLVEHNGSSIFVNLPSLFEVCRYHSLVINPVNLPSSVEVIATSSDDIIMAIQHKEYPVIGLQFHPEAILTKNGFQLLANFLKLAGIPSTKDLAKLSAAEYPVTEKTEPSLPDLPVTF